MSSAQSPSLPTVLVSSVVRSTHQGESHGGLFLLDLATGARRQVIDWNTVDIDWTGRGQDRGLRGIAFHGGEIWVAAADELFVFDQAFRELQSFRNPYLAHCHEIHVFGDRLYLSSTGFDSVLEFDLAQRRFTQGWLLRAGRDAQGETQLRYRPFDPTSDKGPVAGDTIHINNVFADASGVYLSALRLPYLVRLDARTPHFVQRIPVKTHNARPYRDGVLLNNTGREQAEIRDRHGHLRIAFTVPRFPEDALLNGHLPKDHARQAFGRGLCLHETQAGAQLIIGSSPATVSAFDLESGQALCQWTLTMDVRNAVHGLTVWPFARPALDPAPVAAEPACP